MEIKCIALDLDRTTLDGRGRLSEGNRRALAYAVERGVRVVLASGRSLTSLPREVTELPGIEYAITSNGAAVYHLPTGTCLRRLLLEEASVREVLRLTEGEDVVYEAFVDGQAYADAAYVRDPEAYGLSPAGAAYIRDTRRPEADILGFIRRSARRLDSIDLITEDPALKERLRHRLSAVPGLYVTSSIRRLVEVSHRDGGKHMGLRFLLDHLGLSPAETAAFGDGDNDAEMLAFAGVGVAMANATPACLAAADRVTGDHTEDGVADGIYALLGR